MGAKAPFNLKKYIAGGLKTQQNGGYMMRNQSIVNAFERLDSVDLLGYVGQGLKKFLEQEPESETADDIEDWAEGVSDIEQELSQSDLCTTDWGKAIDKWIAAEDKEHFIQAYCPEATNK